MSRVFLIGASMGGAAAVQNSGGLPLAGVVSLSGTRLWTGFGINKPGPRALRVPFLYIGSRNDWRAPLAGARAIVRDAGSRDKRAASSIAARLTDGSSFRARQFAWKTRALILDWIHKHEQP